MAALLGKLFIPGLLIPCASLLFSEHWRYLVMYSGIASDIILPLFFRHRLSKVPVHRGHLAERFGLFVLITFGESLVSITGTLAGRTQEPTMLLFSGLCFISVCLLWLLSNTGHCSTAANLALAATLLALANALQRGLHFRFLGPSRGEKE